jgi:hypothetical protein
MSPHFKSIIQSTRDKPFAESEIWRVSQFVVTPLLSQNDLKNEDQMRDLRPDPAA